MGEANLLTFRRRIARLPLDHSVRPYIRDDHDIAAGDATRIINTSQSSRYMRACPKDFSSRRSVSEKVGASLLLLAACYNEEIYSCF